MASKVVHLTEAGLQKIKSELEHLRSVERPAISAAIAEARDKGDLSENAEYDAAKEAQGMLEMRIAKLEEMVANARVLDESRIDTSSVQILNRVTLKNMKTGKTVEYTLVSESEANLKEGKLSDRYADRPGAARPQKGDKVDVQVPSGMIPFEILDIAVADM
ncbi:MAG: transcription elongation factor GreA [Alistipes indistinctus]